MSPPVNRQIVRDGGAGMETDSSGPSSTRSRTSANVSDSFQTAKQTSPPPSRAWVYTPRTGYGPYIHTGCPYAS